MGAGTGFVQPNSPAATGSGDSGAFETEFWRAANIGITVSTFTAGTTPSITFFFDVLGADGLWYNEWTSAAIVAAGVVQVDLSDSISANYTAGTTNAQHCVFTYAGRLRWTFGGAVNATSINFSASVIGRQ